MRPNRLFARVRRSRGAPVAVVAAVGVALAAWYERPVVQARVVGVQWDQTMSESRCAHSWTHTDCSDWRGPNSSATTTIQFAPVTRRIFRISRSWLVADSAPWQHRLDSTRAAMVAARRERLSCDTAETGFPTAEAWRDGAQEIRLYAGPRVHVAPDVTRRFVSVQLVPLGAAGCGREVVTRMLTPEDLGRAVRAWVAERVGTD